MANQTYLITGGTGSLGQQITRTLLKEYEPKSIRVLSRNEYFQVTMKREFNDDRLRFFIGDVRDYDRLARAFDGVDYVIHTAALKHVGVCEYNPVEAIRTNVDGAINIIDACLDLGVEKCLAVSSDKAVNPINIYGASKFCAERLFINGNVYDGTKFSVVRFGNMVGSNGSIVELAKQGEIKITDPRMTRYWIEIEDAARFTIATLGRMNGGEIFVPDMRCESVTQFVKEINGQDKFEVIGRGECEKLSEELFSEYESTRMVDKDGYKVIC
ncbi:MAG: polysaccharide biosynthesis protein [Planctomycetes bacterium]|nr:polysaccharide biosynthesis protein [Planctomycetota bacterium]